MSLDAPMKASASRRRPGTIAACLLALVAWAAGPAEAGAQVIRSGPAACKAVAFTFDMCPVRSGSGYDEALVRMLVEKRIPATFFLSGRWVETHADQVKALLAVPFFEIGTHGQTHAHLPLLEPAAQREEIRQAVELLRARYGLEAPLFRPPYGEYDDRTVELVRELGLTFVLWDRVSGDPDPRLSREQMVERLTSRAKNGNIIVFHANGKGRHTQAVVEAAYQELAVKRGLQPVTVGHLLGQCRMDGSNGQNSAGF